MTKPRKVREEGAALHPWMRSTLSDVYGAPRASDVGRETTSDCAMDFACKTGTVARTCRVLPLVVHQNKGRVLL